MCSVCLQYPFLIFSSYFTQINKWFKSLKVAAQTYWPIKVISGSQVFLFILTYFCSFNLIYSWVQIKLLLLLLHGRQYHLKLTVFDSVWRNFRQWTTVHLGVWKCGQTRSFVFDILLKIREWRQNFPIPRNEMPPLVTSNKVPACPNNRASLA